MIKTRKAIGALAVGLMGAGALAACAPEAPPATTVPPGGVTTTTAVTYACAGTGIIAPGQPNAVGAIADQTIDVAITLPSSATVGNSFDVTVDVDNLVLAAAPGFLDLNSAGVVATIFVDGGSNVVQPATNFVGNGASIDLPADSAPSDPAVAGTNTVTVGDIEIVAGTTGFACSAISAEASASVDAA